MGERGRSIPATAEKDGALDTVGHRHAGSRLDPGLEPRALQVWNRAQALGVVVGGKKNKLEGNGTD